MAVTALQRRINSVTGVNRRNVNTASRRRGIRNTFRRKSSGGMGG